MATTITVTSTTQPAENKTNHTSLTTDSTTTLTQTTPEPSTERISNSNVTAEIDVDNDASTLYTSTPNLTQQPTWSTQHTEIDKTTNISTALTSNAASNAASNEAVLSTTTSFKNGSGILPPTATVRTTLHPGTSEALGGVDQNLVIVGCIICGLILIVAVAFIILCVRRKRRKKKVAKRILPSTLTFSAISNDNGMIESPSSATINFSERIELIQDGHSHPRTSGVVSIKNDGVVAYHKEDEYIAVWAVDEYMEQQQQSQQQPEPVQQETREEIDKTNGISRSNRPPMSPLPSSNQDLEKSTRANAKPVASSSVNTGLNPNNPQNSPTPPPDYDPEKSIDPPPNPLIPTNKNQRPQDLPLERLSSSSDTNLENIYENHKSPTVEDVGLHGFDIPTTEIKSGFPPYVNGGYEGDMVENPDGTTKPSREKDIPAATVITGTNDVSHHTETDTDSEKPLIQTPIASENHYEENEPDRDYDAVPLRDSGIDTGQDNDSYYDVPADLFNQIRNKHNAIKPENKKTESALYMSPSTNNEENRQLPEMPNDSNYENTRMTRPETYLAPDDLDLKSPTDEDELLKLYDNFSFQNRKESFGKDENNCLYETPGELHEIYEVPSSLKAAEYPSYSDRTQNSTRLHTVLSSSLPAKIGPAENERAFRMTSSSRESEAESEYHLPAITETTIANSGWQESNANYVNSPDSYYANSAASDIENEEVEYHTPNDISHSPFFKNIDKDKAKMGSRSLPPAFKPPPPRLKKPTPLEKHNNTQPPKPGDRHFRNQPTKTQLNAKSLTLDTSFKNGISPRLGGKTDMHNLSPSQKSLNDIHESEDDPSQIYLTPRPSVKDTNTLPGHQNINGLEKTEKPKERKGKFSDSNNGAENRDINSKQQKTSLSGNEGKVDMSELQSAMKKRGLHN